MPFAVRGIAASRGGAVVLLACAALAAGPGPAAGQAPDPDVADAPVAGGRPEPGAGAPAADPVALRLDRRRMPGGEVPSHFLGLSIEWSLIERYMGPGARPAFDRLLADLETGILRTAALPRTRCPSTPAPSIRTRS